MEKEDPVLSAFANAFRTPDLRRKLLFVLLIITIFRLGSQIPAPGVDVANVRACLDDQSNSGVYALINMFSGGALLQLTIFALGIMPYISASIIMQLMTVIVPSPYLSSSARCRYSAALGSIMLRFVTSVSLSSLDADLIADWAIPLVTRAWR